MEPVEGPAISPWFFLALGVGSVLAWVPEALDLDGALAGALQWVGRGLVALYLVAGGLALVRHHFGKRWGARS
jgi:hypothetical protein